MVTEDRAAVFLAYIDGAKLDATVEAAIESVLNHRRTARFAAGPLADGVV